MYKLKNLLTNSSTIKNPINEILGYLVAFFVLKGLAKIVGARFLFKWLKKYIKNGFFKQHSKKALRVAQKIVEKMSEGKIKADTKIAGRPAKDYFTKSAGLRDKVVEIINKTSTSTEKSAAFKVGRGEVVSKAAGMQKSVKSYYYEIMGQNPANLGRLDELWNDVVNNQLYKREWNFARPGSDKISQDEIVELINVWDKENPDAIYAFYQNYRNPNTYNYINLFHTNERLAKYIIEKPDHNILDFMHKNFARKEKDISSFSKVKVFDSNAKGSYRWQAAQGKPK